VWLKDIAPTTELRKWFGHHPARWNEFQKRYHDELKQNAGSISVLKRKAAPSRFFLVRKTKSTMRPWFFDPSLKIDSDTRTAHSNQVTRPEICPNLHQSSASPSESESESEEGSVATCGSRSLDSARHILYHAV
jgi:hypothetical protein